MERKWQPMTDDEFERQFAEATERGRIKAESEPRAISARYDRQSGMIILQMRNDCLFMFPARLGQGLAGASPEDLEQVELTPSGDGLHWEKLDADLYIPSLLMGTFGSKAWMEELRKEIGRKAGSATSEAKGKAARENGKKGGRPRKKAL